MEENRDLLIYYKEHLGNTLLIRIENVPWTTTETEVLKKYARWGNWDIEKLVGQWLISYNIDYKYL